MQEYHVDRYGILENINTLEATQKKSKQGKGEIPITDASLLLIATNSILNMGALTHTTDR